MCSCYSLRLPGEVRQAAGCVTQVGLADSGCTFCVGLPGCSEQGTRNRAPELGARGPLGKGKLSQKCRKLSWHFMTLLWRFMTNLVMWTKRQTCPKKSEIVVISFFFPPLPGVPFWPLPILLTQNCVKEMFSQTWAALKGTNLRGQTPICNFLRVPAVFCSFLRKSTISCENLRFPNALFSRKSRESAKISENLHLDSVCPLRFVPLSAPWQIPPSIRRLLVFLEFPSVFP